MYKAILMSIQPKWLVKILNGEKTIEIRKTMPKCELPIDVYLYCTKGIKDILYKYKDKYYTQHYLTFADSAEVLNSKVVAKFTLNKIEDCCDMGLLELEDKSLLTINEICSYIKAKEVDTKMVYAWHIDNLIIFDKPMELSEFETSNIPDNAVFESRDGERYFYLPKRPSWHFYSMPLTKAPQSWQYAYAED